MTTSTSTPTPAELLEQFPRFWSKVDFDGPGGCWLWTASISSKGYGQSYFKGVTVIAHRLSYELLIGPIPDGLQIDHLCRVRHCVNSDHLEPVTPMVNALRGNGTAAINSRKTHCINGHEFSPINTLISPKGWRTCKACKTVVSKKAKERYRLYVKRLEAALIKLGVNPNDI